MKNYGFTSNGEEITEDMVDEFYRIAESEILPGEELCTICDQKCSIDKDSFEYFNTNTAWGALLSFKIYADFTLSEDITIYDYIYQSDAFLPDFTAKAGAEIQTIIVVKNNEIVDVQVDDVLVYIDNVYSDYYSTTLEKVIDIESFKNAVIKITEPTVNKMAVVLSNI